MKISMLAEGDIAYVIFDEDRDIKVGDEFSVGRSSPLLKNPVTGEDLGYTFQVNGKLKIEERLGLAHQGKKFYDKKNVFKTKVVEVYEPVSIDDSVLPYTSFSSCVLPVSMNKDLVANIVASKGQLTLARDRIQSSISTSALKTASIEGMSLMLSKQI